MKPLAGLIRAQARRPTPSPKPRRLGAEQLAVPGHLTDRPATPARLGVHAQPGRRAALQELAAEVPAAVLADLLGAAVTTAVKWAHTASGGTGPATPPTQHAASNRYFAPVAGAT